MPEWVIVTADGDGAPLVLVELVFDASFATVAAVKAGAAQPVVFADRWAAKRATRKRNEWASWRCIRRDRL